VSSHLALEQDSQPWTEKAMTDRYEAAELIDIGKAEDLIQDQKQAGTEIDNLGVPWGLWAETLDDFDE